MTGNDAMKETGQAAEAGEQRAGPAGAAFAEDGVGDIRYRQTRVVDLQLNHLERNRIVAHNKADPACRVFDLLRTQVLQKMESEGWRTLAVTSPGPEAGKSVVAINLAMSIAHQTSKTAMLVDFDLRKPVVARYLGLTPDTSLNEVLDGGAGLPEAMVNPGMPRLVVLPTAEPVKNPSETLSSRKVASLIAEMRERYDSRIVIFDLPPLLGTDDALAVLPYIDCMMLVVGEGMSSDSEILQSLRYLPSEKLVGLVLNKAEETREAY